MAIYPENISQAIADVSHAGTADSTNAVGTAGCFGCGGIVRFSCRISPSSKKIEQVRFQTNGCGYLMAAADAIAGVVEGKMLTESESFQRGYLSDLLTSEFGEIPADREKCFDHCLDAFAGALADFRAYQLESYQGDMALVCTCFGVSESEIETAITAGSLGTVREVIGYCKAGGGCGSCQPVIQELLDLAQAEHQS